jgi:spore photoproduct lyase
LKGTFRFKAFKDPERRVTPTFKERRIVEKEVRLFLENAKHPYLLNAGELSDGLMQENTPTPFSKFIMELVAGTKHKVLLLTKSTWIQHFLKNDWQQNAILAWSMNTPKVAAGYELYAPTFNERLLAAKQIAEAGYTIRIRFDPMIPVPNWQQEYTNTINELCSTFTPERVTLGTLRGLPATIAATKYKDWTKYLTGERRLTSN